MTDGAAAILTATKRHQEAVARLTSRDPGKFWTSGQWMTEKKGGSDVANGTQTLAVHVEGDRLYNTTTHNTLPTYSYVSLNGGLGTSCMGTNGFLAQQIPTWR